MSALVTTTDESHRGIAALGAGPSVLGERSVKIPTSGKIRAGIKVLTATAKRNAKAVELYDRGVAAGASYAQIEQRIKQECDLPRSPMTPRNVPYFTARRADFAMPEAADKIMEQYGEERDGEFHLYRFPVIFPVDAWQAVMPHGLKTYKRRELLYWSEYGPGGTRYCKTRAPVQKDPRNQRARRAFGGRPEILRPDNDGICDPDQCPQYQARQCNLSGALLFYVPGIPGSSAIELPTTSFYSMQQAREKMEMVAFIRGGKISGTFDGEPIFWITKARREVSMLDPKTGEPTKVKQWLIELEADVDMTALFRAGEARQQLADGNEAARLLENSQDEDDSEFDNGDAAETVTPERDDNTSDVIEADSPAEPDQPDDSEREAVKQARQAVMDHLTKLAIAAEAFDGYAKQEWGDGWGKDASALNKAVDTLTQAADDPALITKIQAAGVPF